MWQSLKGIFDSTEFMPHGHCFLWQPLILWLHVFSDVTIGIAYYSIPVGLVYFARKRPDMPFKFLFVLFSLFILLCGTTHFMSIWVLWHPDYGPEAILKLLTALASIITAVLVWKLMPQMLTAPSPLQLQQLNADLISLNEDVELKVHNRTNELAVANRKLEEAYSLADKASRAKSEFLANMSHEIRTPMNAVIGLSSILAMSQPLTAKQQEYVKTLKLSAESLLALITDLLDISKIESEIVALDNINFDLHRLVTEVVSIVSVKAAEKRTNLTMNFDSHLEGEFIGDPTRIRQILLNLVSNAVKFTDAGSVRVDVNEQLHGPAHKQAALITITDTGIGIPADKQSSIFNKFSQADNTITRKYGGTGLGLAISRSLLELMGGTISVKSVVGKGSVFMITLPIARPDALQIILSQSGAHEPPSNDNGDAEARKHRILLVEDYQPNILVASTILAELGYDYEVAMNGKEALDILAQRPFDLALMDVQMPVLDGYRATRAIREREAETGATPLPIIGITAFAMATDKEKCLNAGMNDYIAKPFDMNELKLKIRKLLGGE